MIKYRKIKMKITAPTIRTTHAPTIPPRVAGRVFDDFWDKPFGTVSITKQITLYNLFHHLHIKR